MKVLFMMDRRANAGSIQAVAAYVRAGDEMGHTVALYGHPEPKFPTVRFSTDLPAFDHVVFIAEFGLGWMSGLRMPRVLREVPRARRAILDSDGMYNPIISVEGYDRNHATERQRALWVAHCASLADRIFQPTLQPLDPAVVPLPFYGYDPSLEIPVGAVPKQFDVVHLAHNWWRWQEVRHRLLPEFERIRPRLDGICFVGSWWEDPPAGAKELELEKAFRVERDLFRELRIKVRPAVPYVEVIQTMSLGRTNIMTQRPLFRRLKLLTQKYFEVFCADTIPLVMLDPDHAESVYGPAGRELALHDGIGDKILDALERPHRYRELVRDVRRHLVAHHSYRSRLAQLVAALDRPA